MMFCLVTIFTLLLSVHPFASAVVASSRESYARIVVPEQVSVTDATVTLGNVADIITRDPLLRSRLSAVDIAVLKPGQTLATVSPSYIEIRLRLAGFSQEQFDVAGGGDCYLELVEPHVLSDREVEDVAMLAFQQALSVPANDLRVRLTAPFVASLPSAARSSPGLRVEVAMPAGGRIGQVSTMVRLWKGDELVAVRPTRFDVLKRQTVAVTLVSLQREQRVSDNNIRLESRFVETLIDAPVPEDLENRVSRRDIKAGELISLSDLKSSPTQVRPIVVNARDNIEVVAVKGRLRVRLRTAQALQSGRVGDMVQFRNLDSSTIRSGRIVAAGQIEIRI